MIWTLAVLLRISWMPGLKPLSILMGFNVLLAIAIVAIVYRVISGRRTAGTNPSPPPRRGGTGR
jgi:hypothetical protein